MKVLVFTSLFPNSIETEKGVFIKERMRHVARLCDIKVVAPVPYFPPIKIFKRWYKYSQIPKEETIDGLEVFHPRYLVTPKIGMAFYGLWMFLGSLNTVRTIHRNFRFDLIDAHYVYPDGHAAILLGRTFNKKVVISARGTDINLYPEFPSIRKKIQFSLNGAAGIISVCQSLKDKMANLGIPAQKIEVISNGVDIHKFYPISKMGTREILNLPKDKQIILSVGHLVPRKGFDVLIKAIADIKNCRNGNLPTLIIIGAGDYLKTLTRLVISLKLENDVLLVGSKSHSDLYKWYSSADIFCLASSREGWPNVLFEALACGIPIIAFNVNGIPEVITSEEYGILVNDRNSKKMADAIITALNKNWDQQKLIEYAQRNTWDKVAEKVNLLYKGVLNNENTHAN